MDAQRTLTGTEDLVWFIPGDHFTGVDRHWLLPRLRLDPLSSPIDLTGGLSIDVNDEEVYVTNEVAVLGLTGTGPHDGLLVSYTDNDLIGGRYDVCGEWVEDWAAEVRHELTWVGPNPDLNGLARHCLEEGTFEWEPQDWQTFEVESPHLDAGNQSDTDFVVAVSGDAGIVILNGTTLTKPTPQTE